MTFDPTKNDKNIAERGLSFERIADLDWTTAKIIEDTRRNYGQIRFQVTGFRPLASGRLLSKR